MLRKFLLVTVISFGTFIVSVLLHNAMGALFGIEEVVFFTIAIFLAPAAFVVGAVGSIVLYVMKRRRAKQS